MTELLNDPMGWVLLIAIATSACFLLVYLIKEGVRWGTSEQRKLLEKTNRLLSQKEKDSITI